MAYKTEDPLIRVSVNWERWKHLVVTVLRAIGKLVEWVLIIILKTLTLFLRGLLKAYKGLKRFAKSNQRGGWILLLLFAIISLLFFGRKVLVRKQLEYQELQSSHQQRVEEIERLVEEKHEVEGELEETKERLETKLNRPTTSSSAKIALARPLPEDIKQIIAKHADAYGISRKYCECIISLESGGRPEATGDGGKAHGVAQYHLGTYLADAKRVGLPVQDDRRDPDKAILAMVGALSRGEDSKWTVSPSCN